MNKYFIDVLVHHYADFKGVATRKQYWLFALWCFIFAIVFIIVTGVLAYLFGIALAKLVSLISLAFIIPHISIFVRRVRDTGNSVFWGLLTIPWALGTTANVLRSSLGIETLNSFIKTMSAFSLLCFIGLLIFALLPSKK